MKKIMFNDHFGLTQAVLEGRKTQTRRIIKTQPPYENFDIAFPVFEEECWNDNPLYGAFCWVNKDNPKEHTEWIKPSFKEGEVIAVAQKYKDVFESQQDETLELLDLFLNQGWDNKMFVRADLMPHQIRITNVRIERLQDISDDDCLKEGIRKVVNENGTDVQYYVAHAACFETPREAFAHLINKVGKKDTWERNPYVWVYDFELIK